MTAQETLEKPQLAIRRTYNAPRGKVYAAFSQAELLAKWFSPHGGLVKASVDLVVGGEWELIMDMADSDEKVTVSGIYTEIVENERLAFSWAWGGTPERVSKVSIDFADQGGKTLLTLTHTQFFDDQARDNHNGGWIACLDNLERYFTS